MYVTGVNMASVKEDNKLRCNVKVNNFLDINVKDIYKNLDSILNNKSETFLKKVQSLIEVWNQVTLYRFIDQQKYVVHLMNWLKLHTLNIVLTGDWKQFKDTYQDRLLEVVKQCEKLLLHSNNALSLRCRKLADVIKDPWGNPVLNKLLNEPEVEITSVEMKFFTNETGYLISTRLLKLCESHCEDMALNLAAAFMRCQQLPEIQRSALNATEDQKRFILDVYVALLDKYKKTKIIIAILKTFSIREGLDLLKRFVNKRVQISKIWKHSRRIANLIAQYFILSCLVSADMNNIMILEGLLDNWFALYDPNGEVEDISNDIRRVIQITESAVYIYMFCGAVHRRFGFNMKICSIELFIRALSIDLNNLERQKEDNSEKVSETTKRLAKGFLCLADVLDDNVKVSREIVLTSFSLHPTQETLDRIVKLAKLSGYPPVDTGQSWKCKLHPPVHPSDEISWMCDICGDFRTKPHLEAPVNTNMALNEALSAEELGISSQLCDDLVVVLSSPRYQLFNWLLEWRHLHTLCVLYLNDPEQTKNWVKELKFVDIDYSIYMTMKKEPEDDLAGIERGYENFLGVEFFNEERPSSSNSSDEDYVLEKPRSTKKRKAKTIPPSSKSSPETLKSLRLFRRDIKRTKEPQSELPSKVFVADYNNTPVATYAHSSTSFVDYQQPFVNQGWIGDSNQVLDYSLKTNKNCTMSHELKNDIVTPTINENHVINPFFSSPKRNFFSSNEISAKDSNCDNILNTPENAFLDENVRRMVAALDDFVKSIKHNKKISIGVGETYPTKDQVPFFLEQSNIDLTNKCTTAQSTIDIIKPTTINDTAKSCTRLNKTNTINQKKLLSSVSVNTCKVTKSQLRSQVTSLTNEYHPVGKRDNSDKQTTNIVKESLLPSTSTINSIENSNLLQIVELNIHKEENDINITKQMIDDIWPIRVVKPENVEPELIEQPTGKKKDGSNITEQIKNLCSIHVAKPKNTEPALVEQPKEKDASNITEQIEIDNLFPISVVNPCENQPKPKNTKPGLVEQTKNKDENDCNITEQLQIDNLFPIRVVKPCENQPNITELELVEQTKVKEDSNITEEIKIDNLFPNRVVNPCENQLMPKNTEPVLLDQTKGKEKDDSNITEQIKSNNLLPIPVVEPCENQSNNAAPGLLEQIPNNSHFFYESAIVQRNEFQTNDLQVVVPLSKNTCNLDSPNVSAESSPDVTSGSDCNKECRSHKNMRSEHHGESRTRRASSAAKRIKIKLPRRAASTSLTSDQNKISSKSFQQEDSLVCKKNSESFKQQDSFGSEQDKKTVSEPFQQDDTFAREHNNMTNSEPPNDVSESSSNVWVSPKQEDSLSCNKNSSITGESFKQQDSFTSGVNKKTVSESFQQSDSLAREHHNITNSKPSNEVSESSSNVWVSPKQEDSLSCNKNSSITGESFKQQDSLVEQDKKTVSKSCRQADSLASSTRATISVNNIIESSTSRYKRKRAAYERSSMHYNRVRPRKQEDSLACNKNSSITSESFKQRDSLVEQDKKTVSKSCRQEDSFASSTSTTDSVNNVIESSKSRWKRKMVTYDRNLMRYNRVRPRITIRTRVDYNKNGAPIIDKRDNDEDDDEDMEPTVLFFPIPPPKDRLQELMQKYKIKDLTVNLQRMAILPVQNNGSRPVIVQQETLKRKPKLRKTVASENKLLLKKVDGRSRSLKPLPLQDINPTINLKGNIANSSKQINPYVLIERLYLEKKSPNSLLASIPGLNDLQMIRPSSVDRIVHVVQVPGSRATTNVPIPSTQTSTQVTPHIQRIGQPKPEKERTAPDSTNTTNAANTIASSTSQSPTLINILAPQIVSRPTTQNNVIGKSRTSSSINILSQQIIKPATSTSLNKQTPDLAQANNIPRVISGGDQILSQLVNPVRTPIPALKTIVSSPSDQNRIVQFICKSSDGKLIPVTSFTSNKVVKVSMTQTINTSAASNSEDNSTKVKSDNLDNSDTLPKFQQAFGKAYQNNADSADGEATTSTDVEKLDKLQPPKNSTGPLNVQPVQGGIIYARQMPVGQTINLVPPGGRGQVFRIATSSAEQLSFVKETVIHGKMSALLAAALQGKQRVVESEIDSNAEDSSQTKIPLTTRPMLVQSARIVKPVIQIPTNVIRTASQSSSLSSTTLEQLREFDMVYKQVKERSSGSAPIEASLQSDSNESPQQISVTYLNQNQKISCAPVVVVSSYCNVQPAASPSLSVTSQGSSSPCVTPAPTLSLTKVATKSPKPKSIKSTTTHASKASPIPKPQQKPQEDEHTTQRIFDILAEYAEQLRNSPDLNNKPAPRRRSNPPTNPNQNAKRKKSSSSKKSGQCSNSMTSDGDIDDLHTVESEDSSCGVVQISMQEDEQQTTPNSEVNETSVSPKQIIVSDASTTQPRSLVITDSNVGGTIKMSNTAVLVPGNYIMPVSMVKGGQQIAVVSGGSKILATVPARAGPNMLLFQSFLNQNKKSTNLPTLKYSTVQPISGITRNVTTITTQVPTTTVSSQNLTAVTLSPTVALQKVNQLESTNRTQNFETELLLTIAHPPEVKNAKEDPQVKDKEVTSSNEKGIISTSVATSVITQPMSIKEGLLQEQPGKTQTIMALNLNSAENDKDATMKVQGRVQSVLVTTGTSNGPMLSNSPPSFNKQSDSTNSESNKDEYLHNDPKRNSGDAKSLQTVYSYQGKIKKVPVNSQRLDRDLHHLSLQRKQAALERELHLQKSLSEECEDLGVDEPSTSDLFPEADLLFDSNHSPSFDQTSQDLIKRNLHEAKDDNKNTGLFCDDEPIRSDFLFEPLEYQNTSIELEYDRTRDASKRQCPPNETGYLNEDNTLLQTCTTMSDVTIPSPISPDSYMDNSPQHLSKCKYKYSNRKKAERSKQVENWPLELSSSEDTTGSTELAKSCSRSPEEYPNKVGCDEEFYGFTIVERLPMKDDEEGCQESHCKKNNCSSGRGARRSVKKLCSCCNGSADITRKPNTPFTQKKTVIAKKR